MERLGESMGQAELKISELIQRDLNQFTRNRNAAYVCSQSAPK